MWRWLIAGVAGAALTGVAMAQSGSTTRPADGPAVGQVAPAAEVPVRVVVLYSSGVGYFEHYGRVTGQATTELRFKTQQINDILKSLVLQDLDGGRISTITYPSQDPINKILRSFQVDITGNPSLGELLNQLRGAKVRVVVRGEEARGTILGVEQRPKAVENGSIMVPVLNLVSAGTIRSVELQEVSRLELEDPQLQEELTKALEALAQARDQDKKPVTIYFTGDGERRVRLGYVVETPIWKTSYRLVMPTGDERPRLQGWAIVENQTESDWNNVQLSLVSGRPISFIQDLYQPLYVPRPVVQPELYASLRPQTYEGGMEADRQANGPAAALRAQRGAGVGGIAETERRRELAAQPAQAPMAAATPADAMEFGMAGGKFADKALDPTASVASIASASQLGELFQYTVGNVTLPRQRSAMIPIITDEIEVERLSIYNQGVLARHPLNGALLKNTTDKHLLQGPVTVLDANAYAGDARIDNVPPGQQRLLSYGVDLQMVVDATRNTSRSTIVAGSIVKGVLRLSRRHEFSQDYVAENKASTEKTLVIEHPVMQGWKLVEPEKPMEQTDQLYRFRVQVPAGQSAKLTVKQERVQMEQIMLLTADFEPLELYARTGEIPQEVRDVLQKAITMRQAMAEARRQRQDREKQVAQITAEQQRIRENLKTVAQDSEYYKRMLAKLNEQETQIEKLQTEIEEYRQREEKHRQELETYLSTIDTTRR